MDTAYREFYQETNYKGDILLDFNKEDGYIFSKIKSTDIYLYFFNIKDKNKEDFMVKPSDKNDEVAYTRWVHLSELDDYKSGKHGKANKTIIFFPLQKLNKLI